MQNPTEKSPGIPTLTDLRNSLQRYGLATYGNKDTLLARLRVYHKKMAKIPEKSSSGQVIKIQMQQNESQKNYLESEKNHDIFVKKEIKHVLHLHDETSKEQNKVPELIEKMPNSKQIKKETEDEIINNKSETDFPASSISGSQIEITDH